MNNTLVHEYIDRVKADGQTVLDAFLDHGVDYVITRRYENSLDQVWYTCQQMIGTDPYSHDQLGVYASIRDGEVTVSGPTDSDGNSAAPWEEFLPISLMLHFFQVYEADRNRI